MADSQRDNKQLSALRASRRRAPQACLHCRKRKVRCDVASKGQPCTNCTLDQTPCEVKRRQQRRQLDNLTPRLARPPSTGRSEAATFNDIQLSQPDTPTHSNPLPSVTTYDAIQREYQSGDEYRVPPIARSTNQSALGDLPSVVDSSAAQASHGAPFTAWTDYPFLDAKTDYRSPDCDAELLRQKGSFSVPIRVLLNELVRQYFLHVHPNLPVINEADFWDAYTNQRQEPMPLMLFQAMLFAACSFVSQPCIKGLCLGSRRAARASFYHRAKAMYDVDIHHDDTASAQTALLLTYYASSRNPNLNSYWLTVALHHAQVIHSHRYYEFTHEKANLLKRIWWACVCRDRLLSLGLRRPVQINAHDFDFSQSALTMSDLSDEIHRSLVYSAESKRELIQLLSLQCELAVALTSGLTLLSPLRTPVSISHEHLSAGVARLVKWYERAQAQFNLLAELGVGQDSTLLHRNLLLVYYHSAQLALQNHAIYSIMDSEEDVEATRETDNSTQNQSECEGRLNSRISNSIEGITECLVQLGHRSLLGYLPITTVANITLPLTWYLVGNQISCMEAAKNAKHATHIIYTRAIKILQAQYEGTDEVLDYIENILYQLRIQTKTVGRKPTHTSNPSAVVPQLSPIPRHEDPDGGQDNWLLVYKFARCSSRQYVRISKTIDVSLAIGRFPEREDLPTPLRRLESSIMTRLHRPLVLPGPVHALLDPTCEATARFPPPDLRGPSIDSLLGEGDTEGQPGYGDGNHPLDSMLFDTGQVLSQPLALDSYVVPEDFGAFSNTSSSGGLTAISAFGSTADPEDAPDNDVLVNAFCRASPVFD